VGVKKKKRRKKKKKKGEREISNQEWQMGEERERGRNVQNVKMKGVGRKTGNECAYYL
jgi:hypothetical protein